MKNTRQLLQISLALISAMAFMTEAKAADITNLGSLNQTQFLSLSKDLAVATTHQPMEPASPLSLTGFDVSVATSMTNTRAGAVWNTATGDSMGHLLQGKVMATKGLPWGVDVGGFVSKSPNTNVSASGFHVKYALLEGGVALPAVAVRSSYSRLGGVSQMDLNNTAVDVLISKGFVGFTPYAGVGAVHSNAKANGLNNINNESFTQSKSFVGVSMNMLSVNLSAEYARVGSASTIGLKAGVRY